MLRNTIQDLRYAMRQIRRAPGFALTVILTLSLSVGVATAVFGVIDAVILRPLPFAHPERIVDIVNHSQSGYEQPASWPSYSDERAQAHDFVALAGYMDYSKVTVDTPSSGPTLLDSVRSTGNFFQVFGVKPLLGRTYLPGEEQEGKNDVAVLSYDLWQNYFGGDRDLPGKTTRLDGRTFTDHRRDAGGISLPAQRARRGLLSASPRPAVDGRARQPLAADGGPRKGERRHHRGAGRSRRMSSPILDALIPTRTRAAPFIFNRSHRPSTKEAGDRCGHCWPPFLPCWPSGA